MSRLQKVASSLQSQAKAVAGVSAMEASRPTQMEKVAPVHQPQQSVQPACGAFAKVVHLQMCTELPQAMNRGARGAVLIRQLSASCCQQQGLISGAEMELHTGYQRCPHHTRTGLRAALEVKAACQQDGTRPLRNGGLTPLPPLLALGPPHCHPWS